MAKGIGEKIVWRIRPGNEADLVAANAYAEELGRGLKKGLKLYRKDTDKAVEFYVMPTSDVARAAEKGFAEIQT